MSGVRTVLLEDICNFEKGSTGLMKAVPGEYPLVTTGTERRTCESYQFDTKAVCIPLVSSTGHGHASLNNVHYQEGKFALGTILVALTAKNEAELDVHFLHLYLFQLKNVVLVPLMKGAANVSLSITAIKGVEIPLPSIERQRAIVGKFKGVVLEEKNLINELTNQKNLLEKLREQILRDAIQGVLTKEWRLKHSNLVDSNKLLSDIKLEKEQLVTEKKINKFKSFSNLCDEEKPYALPDGWTWCRLNDVIVELTDYHANGSYEKLKSAVELLDKPNFAIMLRTTNFHQKSKTNYKYISSTAYEFLSKSKVYPGDVIMNKIANPGATFYVDDRGQPMSLAMNLFLLRFSRDLMVSKYAYYYLKASYEYIVSFSSGTATSTITKDAVKKLRFPLPPLEEQKEIVSKVELALSTCDQLDVKLSNNTFYAKKLMQVVLKEEFAISHKGED